VVNNPLEERMNRKELNEKMKLLESRLLGLDYLKLLHYARLAGVSISFILSVMGILHFTSSHAKAVCCYYNCYMACYYAK